jgi:hypothetical protein
MRLSAESTTEGTLAPTITSTNATRGAKMKGALITLTRADPRSAPVGVLYLIRPVAFDL